MASRRPLHYEGLERRVPTTRPRGRSVSVGLSFLAVALLWPSAALFLRSSIYDRSLEYVLVAMFFGACIALVGLAIGIAGMLQRSASTEMPLWGVLLNVNALAVPGLAVGLCVLE